MPSQHAAAPGQHALLLIQQTVACWSRVIVGRVGEDKGDSICLHKAYKALRCTLSLFLITRNRDKNKDSILIVSDYNVGENRAPILNENSP